MKEKTMATRQIKYSPSSVGRDPKNPLVDIHPDDSAWYFDQLVDWCDYISHAGQVKDEFLWDALQKRRPKHLHKGRNGPNSIVSVVTGLLANYIKNTATYGGCRISKKQMEDLEFVSNLFSAIDAERFPQIQFQQALFTQGGHTF